MVTANRFKGSLSGSKITVKNIPHNAVAKVFQNQSGQIWCYVEIPVIAGDVEDRDFLAIKGNQLPQQLPDGATFINSIKLVSVYLVYSI